ncbi:cytidine deaminase [Limibacillus halophilus]|jgi:cytidine deaminase
MSHDRSPEESEMLRLAQAAKEEAYAPYSGFRVGVCLAAEDGAFYSGCNVENASYPEGSCAETGAIAAMVADGKRRIAQVLVVADGERLCTPCGGCRQRLAEFADPDTPVTVYGPEGFRARFALRELLPHAFDLAGEASA